VTSSRDAARGGSRLRQQVAFGPWGEWAAGWMAWLGRECDPETMELGLQAAKGGLVDSLDFTPGRVDALVIERGSRPGTVRIAAPLLDAATADRLAAGLVADRAAASELLMGTLPLAVAPLLESLGCSLRLGEDPGWASSCSCGDRHTCRHRVAVALLLQERCSEHPWMLLEIRGLRRQDLEERVRIVRRAETDEAANGNDRPLLAEGEMLESTPTDFWRPGPELQRAEEEPTLEHPPLALLRRLGPSSMEGRFPLVGLLASAYEVVAAAGRDLLHSDDGGEAAEREEIEQGDRSDSSPDLDDPTLA
jgi:uncharacterized Zn finger protein